MAIETFLVTNFNKI